MAESHLFDKKVLNEFKKDHIVELVLELQKEKNDMKQHLDKAMSEISERVIELERSHYLYLQYGRRESVEISGIPSSIGQNDLEDEVIKVYNEAKVQVHGNQVTKLDISACHRIGKNSVTIVRFMNRKFAMEGLFNGKNLKGTKLYGGSPIYINNSFCKEYRHYGFIIRNLKKKELIDGYKIKNGVYHIKPKGRNDFVEISHISDFSKYSLDISKY